MQTLVQILCSNGPSVREAIASDPKLSEYGFTIIREKKPRQKPGWLKLRSQADQRQGALNIQWIAASRMLVCRVVNKRGGKPNLIVGDFVAYMLQRHNKRIKLITVVPQ
jgi:hypothetical protein